MKFQQVLFHMKDADGKPVAIVDKDGKIVYSLHKDYATITGSKALLHGIPNKPMKGAEVEIAYYIKTEYNKQIPAEEQQFYATMFMRRSSFRLGKLERQETRLPPGYKVTKSGRIVGWDRSLGRNMPPPTDDEIARYTEYSKRHHAIKANARKWANVLLKPLIENADQKLIKLARRFSPERRKSIYFGCLIDPRFAQLAETFPLLAIRIVCRDCDRLQISRHTYDQIKVILSSVDLSMKMKDLAREFAVPMSARKILPLAASTLDFELARYIGIEMPHIYHDTMPKTSMGQHRWFRNLKNHANHIMYATNVIEWICRATAPHAQKMNGHDLSLKTGYVVDYIRAEGPYRENVSLDRAYEISDQWHAAERVRIAAIPRREDVPYPPVRAADHISYVFPEPPKPGIEYKNWKIIPLTKQEELVEEGAAMHHCVATYASKVANKLSYIYSLRRGGERVATIEVAPMNGWDSGKVTLLQCRAHCNADPDEEARGIIKNWVYVNLSSMKIFDMNSGDNVDIDILVPDLRLAI